MPDRELVGGGREGVDDEQRTKRQLCSSHYNGSEDCCDVENDQLIIMTNVTTISQDVILKYTKYKSHMV